MAKKRGVVTTVVGGYSLSPENKEWLAMRAGSASVAQRRYVSASEFLNGILTGLREKQERAEEAFEQAHKKAGMVGNRPQKAAQ